ncbi:MAG: hypothetical protein AAB426_07365, partial [Myxococcota bacterium]
MHVALVSHSPDLAGAERFLVSAATVLRDAGHEITVFVPCPGALERRLHERGIVTERARVHWWARYRYPRPWPRRMLSAAWSVLLALPLAR